MQILALRLVIRSENMFRFSKLRKAESRCNIIDALLARLGMQLEIGDHSGVKNAGLSA